MRTVICVDDGPLRRYDTIVAAILAKFDGQTIEVPAELRGAAPGDVLILYPAAEHGAVSGAKSIWDVFGKAPTLRPIQDIQLQIGIDRDSWDQQ